MFEGYVESESNTGFKGFVKRHFGRVIHADVAEDGLRQIGLVFIVLYLVSGVFGFASTQNLWILGEALVMAAAALLLYLTKSRVAAVFLLALTSLNAVLALPRLLPWIWVAFAIRATQLAFAYRRLRKVAASTAAFD
jgi:Na+/melibiose symporter-like transporter